MQICPFCPPGIDKTSFAESENFRAVYNIAPILPGHVLIVSKNHVSSFLEVGDEQLTEMIRFSRKIMQLLTLVFHSGSFDWTIQDGKPAGQTTAHFHLHIIPRHDGDLPSPGDWYPQLEKFEKEVVDSKLRPKLTMEQLSTIVERLKGRFNKMV